MFVHGACQEWVALTKAACRRITALPDGLRVDRARARRKRSRASDGRHALPACRLKDLCPTRLDLVPSSLSWLDASAEDQRRMRELVGLFSNTDSRDELGIGQIRDALSDTLFPGTSVLLTRARYLLFVPWCFQKAADSRRPGADRRLDRNERDLIDALHRAGATDGLLGATAGRALKNLPSGTYWNSIRRWNVLADPALGWQDALGGDQTLGLGDEDGAEPHAPVWSSSMPMAPAGFPNDAPGGFDLTPDEADWLAGRILTSCDGTLLAHLVLHRPQPASPNPWSEPASLSAPPDVRTALEHARIFSLLVRGASLLYNLLLAERYVEEGFDRTPDRREHYCQALDTWEANRDASASVLAKWRFDEFRGFVAELNPAISSRTWSFLRDWADLAGTGAPRAADSPDARQFISRREQEHKRGQSRLRNRGLLGSWAGASGAGEIAYRWNAVRRILLDIHDGLERGRA